MIGISYKMNIKNHMIRLPLQGAFNVREIGGYPTNKGGVTKWGVFLRSGDLSLINDNDINLLYEYGIRTIIDLRHDGEKENRSYPLRNDKRFNCVNIPLIDDFSKFSGSMYLAIINIFSEYVKDVFNYIGEHITCGGILFHCVSGKDRTGVIAALLLSLAGVSELDIITNYMVSAIYLRPFAQTINRPFNTLHSEPAEIEEIIGFINEKYSGSLNYLKQIGVSEGTLSNIYNAFCDNPTV